MIQLNEKTKQDFLNKEYVEKLRTSGVDMSDAKYVIITVSIDDYVLLKSEYEAKTKEYKEQHPAIPTYTLSELLYKLDEWPYNSNIENDDDDDSGVGNSGGLTFFKDAPFYFFSYKNWAETLESYSEYPIYAAANLLLWCIKNNVGYSTDISDKI